MQIDQILQPSVSLRPSSLLSLHIAGEYLTPLLYHVPSSTSATAISSSNLCAGIKSLDPLISSKQVHQVTVLGLEKMPSNPLASVLSQGLSTGSVEHSPLGTSFSCSRACLEQLLQVRNNEP